MHLTDNTQCLRSQGAEEENASVEPCIVTTGNRILRVFCVSSLIGKSGCISFSLSAACTQHLHPCAHQYKITFTSSKFCSEIDLLEPGRRALQSSASSCPLFLS